jgi:exportin-2 (importin alpha re-exporter)
MLALSNPTDKTIRMQIAEAVSLIAELDFPKEWPDLLDVSCGYLDANRDPLILFLATGSIFVSQRL